MPTPSYLLSTCAGKEPCTTLGCPEAIKRNVKTGRFFITMGHPGYNTSANNASGYSTRADAIRVFSAFAEGRSVILNMATLLKYRDQTLSDSIAWHVSQGSIKTTATAKTYEAGYQQGYRDAISALKLHAGLKIAE